MNEEKVTVVLNGVICEITREQFADLQSGWISASDLFD